MRDFTLYTFQSLLSNLKDQQFKFLTYTEFINHPIDKCIILRHDVDAKKMNSLKTAQLENKLGIRGTYYFRIVPESFDKKIIKQICDLGHEIGYHYEDLTLARGDKELAIKLFEEHLAKLRRVAPVETICMHGSPLSKYDNRKLWDEYNYRDYGLSGEPYLDTNFNQILYLTDTGRRWDGDAVSVRDKTPRIDGIYNEKIKRRRDNFHSTFDIMNAARKNRLPDKLMITVHPQRWDDNMLPWLKELIWQNIKNIIKRVLTGKQKR